MNIIGKNLLILREALNLTQAEVSDGIDISRDYISKIESGSRVSVSQNIIRSLSIGLSTTEEWLTKNTGWAYDPPTIWKAVEFVERQIIKFKPEEIIILTYKDNLSGNANAFMFIGQRGRISMAGSQTRSDYSAKEHIAYSDALQMIKDAKIMKSHVELDDIETACLIHTNMFEIVKRKI